MCDRILFQTTMLTLVISVALATPLRAKEPSDRPNHPCLAKKHDVQLPADTHFLPPTELQAPSKQAWILEGLITDYLVDSALAQKKHKLIQTALQQPHARLYAIKHRKADRYGRKHAFISLPAAKQEEAPAPQLLQTALLKAGLARVDETGLSDGCAEQLLKAEHTARKAKIGLWKHPDYQAKSATNLHLSAIVSTYQLIHGRVRAVSRRENGTSYLNFGRNWKQDFTVTLSKKSLARWEARNKSLDELKNAYIYVRGWVEEGGGPLIRIHHSAQLWEDLPSR